MCISIYQAERIIKIMKCVKECRITLSDKVVKIVVWTMLRDGFCCELFITVDCTVEFDTV